MSTHTDVHGRSGDLPTSSTPSSSQDLYVDGTLWQRRFYDSSGKVIKDIDFYHTGQDSHTFPHDYYWDWSQNPPRK